MPVYLQALIYMLRLHEFYSHFRTYAFGYGSVSCWNYLVLELSLSNTSKTLKQKQFCNISKKIMFLC